MSGWKELGKRFDERVGRGTEKAGRILNRRSALRTVVLTGAATVGAVALGVRPAFASVTCPEACGPSPLCSHGCPSVGCPSGYTLCQDCKPNHSCDICICVSGIICRECCTPRDVREEQERLRKLLATS